MLTPLLASAALAAASPSVQSQALAVRLEPAEHRAEVTARFDVAGRGMLRFRLNERATLEAVVAGSGERPYERAGDALAVDLVGDEDHLIVRFSAVYDEDVEKGEQVGQIHNFSVNAHIGMEGVFLAEDSAWYPQWIDANGHQRPLKSSLRLEPIDGWAFVASGDPRGDPAKGEGEAPLANPIWAWETPRPVAGVALAGNRHQILGRVHETAHGPVQLVMHVRDEHLQLAPLFLDAAAGYLDLYVPLLGPFPYRRFSIVENFFSSGFAFPGFTLLGPRVVEMAPRSLVPGYLDHEIVHNWWGNGVYVDPEAGDWCEALATYSANYYRRVADGGEAEGREYRRGILMTLSSNPEEFDNGALASWGSPSGSGINRFVGYEKGAFVLTMLERGSAAPGEAPDRAPLWRALRRFAAEFLGRRASWKDLERAIEAELGESRSAFFDTWLRRHTLPTTPAVPDAAALRDFYRQHHVEHLFEVDRGEDADGPWAEVDPNFLVYRLLPPAWIIPTIGGTFGRGGVTLETRSRREEVKALRAQHPEWKQGDGENLLLVGHAAIRERAELIARTDNPVVVEARSFALDGRVYDQPAQALLHSMPHPDRPGRFITVFHSNGEAGWSRLRLAGYYTRDSTIVWEGEAVVVRGVFEPSRKLRKGRSEAAGAGTAKP